MKLTVKTGKTEIHLEGDIFKHNEYTAARTSSVISVLKEMADKACQLEFKRSNPETLTNKEN